MYNIKVNQHSAFTSDYSQNGHNSDELKIMDLNKIKFIVPAYQRGYKWRKKDVEYLIKDLYEYEGINPYYMQPLVVAKDGNKYIVVDGQQRLTTFYLIWRKLYQKNIVNIAPVYSIEYEKRDESTVYLESGELKNNIVTVDVRHFRDAEYVVDIEEDIIKSNQFLKNFFEIATFLWYELEDANNGPKMFERLNGKRIALTDVELCKVLLLSSNVSSKSVRSERAMAWQNMEYRLQDNTFYAFISKDYTHCHDISRMDLIIKAVCNIDRNTNSEAEYEEYPLYTCLKKKINTGENVWKNIVNTFHRIEMWYDNLLYYNLIGFLIEATNCTVSSLLSDVSSSDFGNKLRDKVIEWTNTCKPLRDLVYKNDETKSVLLLYNVLCDLYINPNPKSKKIEERYGFTSRFRFDLYRAEKYDKEHVHATNSEMIQSAIEWRQWCDNILKYTPEEKRKDITDEQISLMRSVVNLSPDGTIDDTKERTDKLAEDIRKTIGGKDGFKTLFESINAILGEENDSDLRQNSIGNMALLSVKINRNQAYAASPFAIKRAIIIEKQQQGFFVPKGTERMFTKAFRAHPDEMYHWNKTGYANGAMRSDSECFTEYFAKMIERFTK